MAWLIKHHSSHKESAHRTEDACPPRLQHLADSVDVTARRQGARSGVHDRRRLSRRCSLQAPGRLPGLPGVSMAAVPAAHRPRLACDTVVDVLEARPSRAVLLTNRHVAYLCVKKTGQQIGSMVGAAWGLACVALYSFFDEQLDSCCSLALLCPRPGHMDVCIKAAQNLTGPLNAPAQSHSSSFLANASIAAALRRIL